MNAEERLRERLVRFIGDRLGKVEDLAITGIQPAQPGASTENWLFDAAWRDCDGPQSRRLILRMAPGSEVVLVERKREFSILRALSGRGLPTPAAYWIDVDGTHFGRPAMILERLSGRADRNLLNARNGLGLDAASQLPLARAIADALADIHGVDAASLDLADPSGGTIDPAEDQLAIYRDRIEASVDPIPDLRLALWWLEDNRPRRPRSVTIVHGDFRPANMMVAGARLQGVIDWEFAHVGDPAEDLGWYLAAIYRQEHFIRGFWSPEDFIARYETRTGYAVDRHAVRFWSVFAHFKLASIALATLAAFRAGDLKRIVQYPDRHLCMLMRSVANDGRDEDIA